MKKLSDVLAGYKRFRQKFGGRGMGILKKLARGQAPKVAIIACSDSRVDPSIITSAKLGELFVIRNVANLVPPYQPDHGTYHGTSAALEFAINNLNVEHVIVFGHSGCAGIHTLLHSEPGKRDSFVSAWVSIADEARKETLERHGHETPEHQSQHCERKAIEHSLRNLMTFPWVAARVQAGSLELHGWHFVLDSAELWGWDEPQASWQQLV